MTDILSMRERSILMSRVRSHNTTPEGIVRTCLHKMGLRFRLQVKKLPGTPDVVLRKYSTAIFVHGCFWHRHPRCKKTTTPKTRVDFWTAKFRANISRDRKARRELIAMGWRVVTIWECQTKDASQLCDLLRCHLPVKTRNPFKAR